MSVGSRGALGRVSAFIIFCAGCLAAVVPTGAATLQVGGAGAPYQSIQSAIDAALPGVDDVAVACGVYAENLVLKSGVDVIGAGAGCAIVDGGGADSVVRAVDIGSSTTLAGLTLRNGQAAQGGGIFMESSNMTVRDLVIENNHAVGAAFPGGVGGGIHVQTAFLTRAPAAPVIERNVIRGNTAERFGGGISIDTDDGSTIAGNLIVGNSAVLSGGGIDVFASFPDIINNTVVGNCVQDGTVPCQFGGGGIALTDSGVVEFYNNVVVGNEAPAGQVGGVNLVGSTADFRNNDTFGNLPADYSAGDDPTGVDGNIAADPLFADRRESHHGFQPRSDSPLVDAGTTSFLPPLDLRGVPRNVDGDADGLGGPDIGARENEGASRLGFISPTQLGWDTSIDGSAVFDVYRGTIAELRAGGGYMQDPVAVDGAAQWCGLASPALTDAEDPPSGECRFYIAIVSAAVDGTLGFDGAAVERAASPGNACP